MENCRAQGSGMEDDKIYTFKHEDGLWYIHFPAYLEQGWSKKDLQMAEGAHKFLNALSKGAKTLRLHLSQSYQAGWDVLELIEHCDAPRTGAIYLYKPANAPSQGSLFWIYDLALFVFGDMPQSIYVQRLPGKERFSFTADRRYLTEWQRHQA